MGEGQGSPVALTGILKAWSGGDGEALERLTPIVYAELHRLARMSMARQRNGHLMQPSALVNEAFVRLIGGTPVEWESRNHFFAVSATVMRQILIDFSRGHLSQKRGEGAPHVELAWALNEPDRAPQPMDFLDLDAALNDLAALAPRQARVVELRYFGGLENTEIASILGTSEPTVVRDWRAARAWLFARLLPQAPA
jgi:RNA polymerase sigma factor (TIGR02999 family)